MAVVAILLGFASLCAFFAFALAHQQRQTASDCALEGMGTPSSKQTWWLCYFFCFLALIFAVAGGLFAFCTRRDKGAPANAPAATAAIPDKAVVVTTTTVTTTQP